MARSTEATRCNSSDQLLVSSTQNSRVKLFRALLQKKKSRDSFGLIPLEGRRLVIDALRNNVAMHTVFVPEDISDARNGDLCEALRRAHVVPDAQVRLAASVMRQIGETTTPQGVYAIARVPSYDKFHENRASSENACFVVICDNVRDPGNMGTIVRSASAAGAHALLCSTGCVDIWAPKVIRSAMGAHFTLPLIQTMPLAELLIFAQEKLRCTLYVADAGGDAAYYEVDWKQNAALLVGSEATGPQAESLRAAQSVVHIPMSAQTESLNAGVAASIIMFEAQRQRRAARDSSS